MFDFEWWYLRDSEKNSDIRTMKLLGVVVGTIMVPVTLIAKSVMLYILS